MDRPVSLEARRIHLTTSSRFRLGRASIDPAAHEIEIDGRSQRMQPQTLKVLIALHDKSSRVVTRQELIDRCWDGRIVGEDVINRCVSLLRRFENEACGFRIETVPREGYRLTETGRTTFAMRGRRSILAAVLVGLFIVVITAASISNAPDKDRTGTPTI